VLATYLYLFLDLYKKSYKSGKGKAGKARATDAAAGHAVNGDKTVPRPKDA